jgi:Ca2+-binding EF-hand superfamily protein
VPLRVIYVVCILRGGAVLEKFNMKKPVKELGFAVILAVVCVVSQTFAASKAGGALQLLDSDHDGTVDLNETKTAASALFDRLDRDHNGTLDKRELKGRLSAKELAAEDGDHDGTLTKDEYLAAVEKRFKAANTDNDDTLDAKELGSRSGRALQRLVR